MNYQDFSTEEKFISTEEIQLFFLRCEDIKVVMTTSFSVNRKLRTIILWHFSTTLLHILKDNNYVARCPSKITLTQMLAPLLTPHLN